MLHVLLICCAALLCAGCKKSADAPGSATTPPVEAPSGTTAPGASTPKNPDQAEAALSATLAQLTQVLRKYSAEKQQVPKSLQELVTSGYITELPAPPPGKKFAINEKRVEVIVANR